MTGPLLVLGLTDGRDHADLTAFTSTSERDLIIEDANHSMTIWIYFLNCPFSVILEKARHPLLNIFLSSQISSICMVDKSRKQQFPF